LRALRTMLARRAVLLIQLGRHAWALFFRFLTLLESALTRSLPFHTRISRPKPFRINTSTSVDPKQLKVPLESALLKNRGRGGPLSLTRSVNQKQNKALIPVRQLVFVSPFSSGETRTLLFPASDPLFTAHYPLTTAHYLCATISPPHLACARSFRIGGCHE
jgi:hypothetical protein